MKQVIPKTLLYLHGFRSSPESKKASFLRDFCQKKNIDFICPPLDLSPKTAISQVNKVVQTFGTKERGPFVVIGSSLGGFYATWLMQTWSGADTCIAIVINPAVRPVRDLQSQVVELKPWQVAVSANKPFSTKYHDELAEIENELAKNIKYPDNILLVAAKGDEVLNWEEMVQFYKNCQHYIVEGSDHGMSDFATHWKNIKPFIGLV